MASDPSMPAARESKSRYHRLIMVRSVAIAVVGLGLSVGGFARAETFGGFSGVDRPYLVDQDRVCAPLAIASGEAHGTPRCEKVKPDALAALRFKPPVVQSGAKASFAATASGRTLTVLRRTGEVLFTWETPDPIARVVEVFASQYEDRVAVAYVTRRMGKEVSAVIAFDLGQSQTAITPPTKVDPVTPPVTPPTNPTTPDDPALKPLVEAARKAPKAKALVAWRAVLAQHADHAEALYAVAALQLAANQRADALASIAALAKSPRADAIEWLVEARFAPAFAGVRGEPAFRAAVGLDRKPATPYEHVMGLGGTWEQTGTSCDAPEVRLAFARERTFQLRVKTTCEGRVFDTPFKGTWSVDDHALVLALPTRGQKASDKDQFACGFEAHGDEDAIHCTLGRDLEFVVLPTRR